jgi:hypothetical protein
MLARAGSPVTQGICGHGVEQRGLTVVRFKAHLALMVHKATLVILVQQVRLGLKAQQVRQVQASRSMARCQRLANCRHWAQRMRDRAG